MFVNPQYHATSFHFVHVQMSACEREEEWIYVALPLWFFINAFTYQTMDGWVISITKACAIWQFPINENVHSTQTLVICVCFSICNNKQWITTICSFVCSLLLMFLNLWTYLVLSSKPVAFHLRCHVPLITVCFTDSMSKT